MSGNRGGPLPWKDQKKSLYGSKGRGQKKKYIDKRQELVFVPLTSVPKEKNMESFEGLSLPILLMLFDGEKIQMCLRMEGWAFKCW